MDWLALITLVLKAVGGVVDYLSNRQLLDAAKAEILSQGLQQTLDNIQRANHVKDVVDNNPTGDFANRVRNKYTRTDE